MEEVIIAISMFTMIGSIVYFVVNGRVKGKKMEHDVRMLAIEKGVDIPLSPSSAPRKQRHYNPYLWPFILIGLGIALVFSDMLGGHFDFGSKMIPLMIGVAMLIAHATHSKYKKKHGIAEIEDEKRII